MDIRKTNSILILEADQIPVQWFGSADISRKEGASITREVFEKVFRLTCGCIVRGPEECGAVCSFCFQTFQAVVAARGITPGEVLSIQQLEWMATPCVHHFHRCEVEMCHKGFCMNHGLLAPDGTWRCLEHLEALEKEEKVKTLLARLGGHNIEELLR